jgi:hypothetical protein
VFTVPTSPSHFLIVEDLVPNFKISNFRLVVLVYGRRFQMTLESSSVVYGTTNDDFNYMTIYWQRQLSGYITPPANVGILNLQHFSKLSISMDKSCKVLLSMSALC